MTLRPLSEVPLSNGRALPRRGLAGVERSLPRAEQDEACATGHRSQSLGAFRNGELDRPFQWAIAESEGRTQDLWRFHYGAWLAGSGNTDEAIAVFSAAQTGVAKAMLARLLRAKGDNAARGGPMPRLKRKGMLLHPQIVVEEIRCCAPTALRRLRSGKNGWPPSMRSRTKWIAERRVQLLIHQGEFARAKELLLSTEFQKVHQTYSRTGLWRQICESCRLAHRYRSNWVKISSRASAPTASTTNEVCGELFVPNSGWKALGT